MLDTLDAAAVRRWCGGGLAALRAHQKEIDALNVYPVPDGDTGTNLVLTLASAYQALGGAATDGAATDGAVTADGAPTADGPAGAAGGQTPLGHTLRLMARGALLGARGNSGVIVSQILRGMADSLALVAVARGKELAAALRSATESAYAAVAKPVEGTVLSVVAAAAEAATRLGSDDVVAVARAAAGAAAEALARTPSQLAILARAGVVDAGGRGLCVLLDALVEALDAITPAQPQPQPQPGPTSPAPVAGPLLRECGSVAYAYEVQYLLDAEPDAVERLRATLGGLGDSLVVVGTGTGTPPTWNVHVHVNEVGPAIEAGVVAGRPYRIAVTRFADQIGADQPGGDEADGDGTGGDMAAPERVGDRLLTHRPMAIPTIDAQARAAVVVAAGDGLTTLFEAEGATVVDRNPSTAEVLDAIRCTVAGRVALLPNDANAHAVALSAAREAATAGIQVSVVPTRSPVQALAALAVRDPDRSFSEDVIAMAEAAGACRSGEVCTASREALTVAGRCRPGDQLGLVDGEVHVIGDDLAQVCRQLLDRMLGGGGELATLVLGADAPPELEGVLRAHVAQVWPFVDLQCYTGGQPRYHLLVGVE